MVPLVESRGRRVKAHLRTLVGFVLLALLLPGCRTGSVEWTKLWRDLGLKLRLQILGVRYRLSTRIVLTHVGGCPAADSLFTGQKRSFFAQRFLDGLSHGHHFVGQETSTDDP